MILSLGGTLVNWALGATVIGAKFGTVGSNNTRHSIQDETISNNGQLSLLSLTDNPELINHDGSCLMGYHH